MAAVSAYALKIVVIRHVVDVKADFMALACAAKRAKKCKRMEFALAYVNLNANLGANVMMGLAFVLVLVHPNASPGVSV